MKGAAISMTITNYEPYQVANEYNITELLAHFDADYILDVLEDKLNNANFISSLSDPNFVASFEENFKLMNEEFPGDSQNIRNKREEVYTTIIDMLTKRFNLEFNTVDPNIDLYTAAYYLYDFLVCRRNIHMQNFFIAFIINNKDSLYSIMNIDDFRKSKDASSAYSKRVYDDPKIAVIDANMNQAISYINTMDISLLDIFQSIYTDSHLVSFMDNCFRDKDNFYRDYYCAPFKNPEIAPVLITNIKLGLQQLMGSATATHVHELIMDSVTN